MDSLKVSGNEFLFKECVAFCNALTEKGCKYSFSLKLGQSYEFTLKSEMCTPPKAKKRSPSYLKRQLRRKEAFLKKRTDFLPEPAGVAQGHSKEEPEGEVTRSPPYLDLCPKPKFPRQSEGSVDSSATEDDAVQQSTADVSTESPSIRLFHPENEEEVLQAGSVDKEEPDKGAEWARVARRRQIPDARPVNLAQNSAGPTRQANKKHRRSHWSPKRVSDFRQHWVNIGGNTGGRPNAVLVHAPPYAAIPDIKQAVLNRDFTKIKEIPGIGYEFNNQGHFKWKRGGF